MPRHQRLIDRSRPMRQTRGVSRILRGAIPLMEGLDTRGKPISQPPDDPPNVAWTTLVETYGALESRGAISRRLRLSAPGPQYRYNTSGTTGVVRRNLYSRASLTAASEQRISQLAVSNAAEKATRTPVNYPDGLVLDGADQNHQQTTLDTVPDVRHQSQTKTKRSGRTGRRIGFGSDESLPDYSDASEVAAEQYEASRVRPMTRGPPNLSSPSPSHHSRRSNDNIRTMTQCLNHGDSLPSTSASRNKVYSIPNIRQELPSDEEYAADQESNYSELST